MVDPRCWSCGAPLVLRQVREGQNRFWGCQSYPDCRVTLGGDDDSGPLGIRECDGPLAELRLFKARHQILLSIHEAPLGAREKWEWARRVTFARDLLELGDLRHQLQRAGRGQGS